MQKKARIAVGGVALCLAIAGMWRYGLLSDNKSTNKTNTPVIVSVVTVALRDTPVYLNSVATVQAYNTVVVRSRVDGEISKVAFKEGTNVRRSQVLIELDRRPFEAQLRAARAQREKDIAQFDNANLDLARYETLVKTGSAPVQILDATKALVAQLKASVHADEAQIDQATLQLEYATIRAPIDGRAGARLIDIGNVVHAGDISGLLTITQIHPVQIQFSLPQSVVPELRHQQAHGTLSVEALDEAGDRVLDHGTLTFIDNQIDPLTRTILCKAIFENRDEALWPGAFVTARLHLSNLPRAIVVPATAIQPGSTGSFVYVVTPKQTAEIRQVEVGTTNRAETVILKGLQEGETVVTEGQFQIEQGTRVETRTFGRAPVTSGATAKPNSSS